MADITDTLILIQIKAFIAGQRSAATHTNMPQWALMGYDKALDDLSKFIYVLQEKAGQIYKGTEK